jgi:hypothetical protein
MAYDLNYVADCGKVLSVQTGDDVTIITDKGRIELFHSQDCCESVYCVSDHREIEALVGQTIVKITRQINDEAPEGIQKPRWDDSYTYTLFCLELEDGEEVEVWFLGESNGYYCETAEMDYTVN